MEGLAGRQGGAQGGAQGVARPEEKAGAGDGGAQAVAEGAAVEFRVKLWSWKYHSKRSKKALKCALLVCFHQFFGVFQGYSSSIQALLVALS